MNDVSRTSRKTMGGMLICLALCGCFAKNTLDSGAAPDGEQHSGEEVKTEAAQRPKSEKPESPTPSEMRGAPRDSMTEIDSLTISASTVGVFGDRRSWHLSVNSAGKAELTIDTWPAPTRRQFNVPWTQLTALRRQLIQERFFELGDDYGEQVLDGSTDTLTLTVGNLMGGHRAKTVRLHYLMNWVHYDKAKLREPSRAVRVLLTIRDWFEDPEAVDHRRYYRIVLEASPRD